MMLTLLLTLAAAPVLASGGQEILIADEFSFPGGNPFWDVEAANDGTLFAICHGDTANTIMNVYRSNNGGSTWFVWDTIESFHTDGRVHDADLTITDGNPGSVLIAWIDQRLDSPGSWVRVSRAPVADEVPSWSTSQVYFIFNLDVETPRIDSIPAGFFQHRVVVAFKSGDDLEYANSEDSGDTWSTPLTIFTGSYTHQFYELDVAADNSGVAHMIWTSFHWTDDIGRVHYRRSTFGGELIGNWETPRILFSNTDNGYWEAAIVADQSVGPGGGGVAAMACGPHQYDLPILVFESDNAGVTMVTTGTLDLATDADLAMGSSGPVLSAAFPEESALGSGWGLITPNGNGGWNEELLVALDSGGMYWFRDTALALDPTRDDAPFLVGATKGLGESSNTLWFDGAWRGDDGYGVPDPPDFHNVGFGDTPVMVLTGDVTGDAAKEVVLVIDEPEDGRLLFCLHPVTGGWMLSNSDMSPVSNAAMVNLDDEPALEVFSVRQSDARLDGKDGDGNSLPGFPMSLGLGDGPYFLSGGPMVNEAEDWLVVAEGNKLTMLMKDGEQPEGWPWTAPASGGVINGRVAFGDVDGDGLGEIVVPLTERTVVLNHLAEVESVFGAGMAAAGTPSMADLDDDGDLEIVIPRSDGWVHLVHHDGTPAGNAWPYDTGIPGTPSQVALADIAGDDRRDLIFMDAAHGVHAVTPGGTVVMNWDMDVPLGSPVVEPMVARVGPGAGQRAVIIGGVDGRLRLRTLDGFQDGWPRDMGGEIHAPVAVADTDSDGKVEMIVATTEDIWSLDMGVSGPFASEIWSMSGADPRRRGSVGSGPVSGLSATPMVPEAAMALHGAAPNPFNPATSIRFSLTSDVAHASLRVYDVAGRLVKNLHQGSLPAGDHQTMWRGDDDSGRAVASGVYYVRLEADGQSETRPMVLAR